MASPLRNAMVYLGLAEEEEYEQQPQQQAVQPVAAPAQPRGQVTPLRRAAAAPRNAGPAEMNEILTVHPREYKDAQIIAEHFREGVPVIMNLSQMHEGEARRLVDFASGLAQGLYGKIERVTSMVFLLSPAHVQITGDAPVAGETGPVVEY